jgi:hypothetical protein
MAAGHRVAAHSVLDRPEHGGTLPLDGDNTATNIMVGYATVSPFQAFRRIETAPSRIA